MGGGRPDTVQFSSPRVPSSNVSVADLSMLESTRNWGLAVAADQAQTNQLVTGQGRDTEDGMMLLRVIVSCDPRQTVLF